jgi:hypothetical protein
MAIQPVIDEVVSTLTNAGLYATADPGAFYPSPIGCLVGLPSLVARGLQSATVEVPVHVICTEPLDARLRNALYDAAWDAAVALGTDSFDLDGWSGQVNQSDLPAYTLTATVTYS